MIYFDKITEIYSIVNEFWQNFDRQISRFILGNKPKRPPKINNVYIIQNAFVKMFRFSQTKSPSHIMLITV